MITWTVTFQSLDKKEKSFTFSQKRMVVGRLSGVDLEISDLSVSPMHAVIEMKTTGEKPQCMLYDLASEQGCFVENEKVVTQPLMGGETVCFGKTCWKVVFHKVQEDQIYEGIFLGREQKNLLWEPFESFRKKPLFREKLTSEKSLQVIVSWNQVILEVKHFWKEKEICLGDPSQFEHGFSLLGGQDRIYLLNKKNNTYWLKLYPGLKGVIHSGDQVHSLSKVQDSLIQIAGGYELPLKEHDFVKLEMESFQVYLSFVPIPPSVQRDWWGGMDPVFRRVLAAVFGMALLTCYGLSQAHVEPKVSLEELPPRVVKVLTHPEKYGVYAHVSKTFLKLKSFSFKNLKEKIPKTFVPIQRKKSVQKGVFKKKRSGVKQKSARSGIGVRGWKKEGRRGQKIGKKRRKAMRAARMRGRFRHGGAPLKGVKRAQKKDVLAFLGSLEGKLGKTDSRWKGVGGFVVAGKDATGARGKGFGGGGKSAKGHGLKSRARGFGKVGTGVAAEGFGTGILGGKAQVFWKGEEGGGDRTGFGGVDASAIEAALRAHRDAFRYCYEEELNRGNPDLSGTVKVRFVIGMKGQVVRAGIAASSLKSSHVERCVLNVIRSIRFPKPEGGGWVEVSYPFRFRPVGG